MTDNEIKKALECCNKPIRENSCTECAYYRSVRCSSNMLNDALDLINRQKAEIERLNKNYEELIYKIECLLCHATGNKFSKYTYTTQEMLSFVDDYIQDCCDEGIEETKATAKSEAIKEFAERLKGRLNNLEYHENSDRQTVTKTKLYHVVNWIMREVVPDEINNLVKEMTE